MKLTARGIVPVIAVLVALATAVTLSLSLGTIRTRAFFERTIRRIEILDRRGEYDESFQGELREAARYARSTSDWRQILQLAWKLPAPERWVTVEDLSTLAATGLPHDARWKTIGAYASVRRGSYQRAISTVSDISPSGETVQSLRMLAALSPRERSEARTMVESLLATDSGTFTATVGGALLNPDAQSLHEGWEATGIRGFALNSALYAAAEGNRELARRNVGLFRDSPRGDSALLYLAAWLEETDWFFRMVRALPARDGVAPDVMLLQAEGHLYHAQWDEARRIYRELQNLEPHLSPIPFHNDAVLAIRADDGTVVMDTLKRGENYHSGDRPLRFALAGELVRQGRPDEAQLRLEAILNQTPDDHDAWLLQRLIQARYDSARGAPPERLEGDLWTYLNRHPDAHRVAAHLARIFLVRGDETGLEELRRRYPPDTSFWSSVVHMSTVHARHDPGAAERLVEQQFSGDLPGANTLPRDWTRHYNRSLFALRHLPLSAVEHALGDFRQWLYQESLVSPAIRKTAETHLLVLEAEYARLQGDIRNAVALVSRAIELSPDRESLYSYRARLAP